MLQAKPMTDTNDEYEIIRNILAGDRNLFSTLVQNYQDRVYAIAFKQIGNAAIAEDLAQEIFIKAYKNLKRFRFEASFGTWLIRITLNHTYSYLSSRKNKNSLITDELIPELEHSKESDVSQQLEIKESIQSFFKCFAKLSEKFQAVITLCLIEEKDYENCAEIINIPVGTVRSRLHKGRQLVINCMGRGSHE